MRFKAGVGAATKNRSHDRVGAEVLSELPQIGVVRVRSRWGEPGGMLIDRYKSDPAVEFAEPNWLYYLQFTPNDPKFPLQWDLNNTGQSGGTPKADVRAQQAWDITTGSSSVIVALIDTGVDTSHPDLVGNLLAGKNFVAGEVQTDVADLSGHGTHVAGTIAAVGNNANGVAGIAWTTKILPLKISDQPLQGAPVDVAAAAILYAADAGAKISNNSYAGPYSATLESAIQYANTKGMLVIAAAGNKGLNVTAGPTSQAYPCSSAQPNVICVAATDRQDLLANFALPTCCSSDCTNYPSSNYGGSVVHLGAPGKDIVSTGLNNTYPTRCGTSTAAPHVAGAAALLLAHNPMMTAAQLKSALLSTVDLLPSLAGKTISGGRLNIARALQAKVLEGYHDGQNCTWIYGWAWDHTNTPVSVGIYNGTSLLATSPANVFRQDLKDAGKGDGYHGFLYGVPQSIKDGVTHSIRVKYAGTTTDLLTTPKSLICHVSVFTTQVPAHNIVVSNYENAMQFSSSLNGKITAIRFYKWPGETGTHIGRLWSDTGSLLAAVTFSSETESNWQEQPLVPPVTITAGTKYRVSYNENVTHSKTDCGLASPITNGPLTGLTSFYTTPAGNFPTTFSCSNFFIDIRFDQ